MRTTTIFLRLLFGIFPKNCQVQKLRLLRQQFLMVLWAVVVILFTLGAVAYKIVCYNDDIVLYANNDGRILTIIIYGFIVAALGCWALMPDEETRQPART